MPGSTTRVRSPLVWLQFVAGLFGWSLAVVLMVRSNLGLGPWDLFHQGLARWSGLPMGLISQLVGLVLLLTTLRLGIRPRLGTAINMLLIGVFIDLLLLVLPEIRWLPLQLLSFGLGIALVGLSSGLYIAAQLGIGPRDGLMLGLSARLSWPVRRVRTLIELQVLLAGWLLGGTIGVGTLLFALLIGPSVQFGLRLCGALPEQQPRLRRGGASS